MSGVGLQPWELWNQSDRLPVEERKVLQKTRASREVDFFVA
jgi:hypothetical protein